MPTQDSRNPKKVSGPKFVFCPRLQNIRLFQNILQDFIKSKLCKHKGSKAFLIFKHSVEKTCQAVSWFKCTIENSFHWFPTLKHSVEKSCQSFSCLLALYRKSCQSFSCFKHSVEKAVKAFPVC